MAKKTDMQIELGLMILLDQKSGWALQEFMPLIAGIGLGMLFHTPYGILTSSMPEEELASTTGAFFLVRFIGTTTGLVSCMAWRQKFGMWR